MAGVIPFAGTAGKVAKFAKKGKIAGKILNLLNKGKNLVKRLAKKAKALGGKMKTLSSHMMVDARKAIENAAKKIAGKTGKGKKSLASRLADKVQNLPARQRPNTVAVLKTRDGQIIVGRNQGGVINNRVQQVLKDIPPNEFNGECAEVNVISRALNKKLNLNGAEITVANVRGAASTTGMHGTSKAPCNVCKQLLNNFGVKNVNP
ncbi:YwqJ-related putative deaminase [Anaerosinus massiliensis]|uniref:YwqJ-related putative deaminase n=1 Tax=Massilibacillus massiliensis TaxID=1806837 RepID=UPI000DA62825|nr:YwqJ-related putative deaminase [Massilibacillus massiliensis]